MDGNLSYEEMKSMPVICGMQNIVHYLMEEAKDSEEPSDAEAC